MNKTALAVYVMFRSFWIRAENWMSEPKRHDEQNRFVPRPNPDAAIFHDDVKQWYIDDCRNWVRNEGTPDLWQWNTQTAPPKGSPAPKILAIDIDVPEILRAKVGRAPCPLCSISHEKYFRGMLVQYREEGVLRVIGHECGERIHGAAFSESKREFRLNQAQQNAFFFLINNVDRIAKLASLIPALADTARKLDNAREQFKTALGKENCKKISRHALEQGSSLRLYDTKFIPILDKFGRPQLNSNGDPISRPVADLVYEQPFVGCESIRSNESASAQLFRAHELLRDFPSTDEDIEHLDGAALIDFQDRARTARSHFLNSLELCRSTQSLMSNSNMNTLIDWSSSRLCPLKIHIKKEYEGRFICGTGKSARVLITVKPELCAAMPADVEYVA